MNREILERPFLAAEVKQREGMGGAVLDYVEGHTVIARLNEAFDGVWDFVIKSFEVAEARDEVLVVGRLTAGGVTKMQFGASGITRSKGSSLPVSIADDLKAAATDALKKCATLFGVGLHLYAAKGDASNTASGRQGNDRQRATQGQPERQAERQPQGRISARQHSYLLTLSREQGLTRRELDGMCQERFGVVLDHVTKSEASRLIEEFGQEQAQPHGAQGQNPEPRATGGVQ